MIAYSSFLFFFVNHEIQLINDLDQKLLVHTLIHLKIKRLKFKDTLITGTCVPFDFSLSFSEN